MARTFALPGTVAATAVKVAPLVVTNIADAYTRRPEGAERVVGALLGAWAERGLEVRNAYAVPHSESEGSLALDVEYFRQALELHLRASPRDALVGWFSTGSSLAPTDTLVHEFVSRHCSAPPVHLVVDPHLVHPPSCVTAWMGSPLSFSPSSTTPIGTHFQQIPAELRSSDAERVGTSLVQHTISDKKLSDLSSLDSSLAKLEALLDRAHSYADDVCSGSRDPDSSIGRFLSESLSAVPHLPQEQLASLFDETSQDLGVVLMLSQMTRTHTNIAERLNSSTN